MCVYYSFVFCIFFFKQKTAYEMRISDWSSDVCSSDLLAVLPQELWILVVVMAVLESTRVFRLGRAVAMDVAVMEFVEAARLRGEGRLWIIFREILPNTLSPLLAEFGLRFAFAVLFLSTISFLGLGIQPPEADWGGIVKDNSSGIIFGIPAALIPGAAIAALAISEIGRAA